MQTITFEGKKDYMKQLTNGSWKLVLTIHPEDVTPLAIAPVGQAFMCVLAPINGGEPAQIEKPEKDSRKWPELSHTEQAGILSSSDNFHLYLASQRSILWDTAQREAEPPNFTGMSAYCIRNICGVTSRKEIKRENTAGAKFRHLCAEYFAWKEKQ